ncbi:abortive phage resistance protein [Salmonella enterica subsp. salamae serovar 4,12:e,n,x:1,6]|nr:abortive phage resistance protein [Salmonella enterica subsp. salamae serovar 4,12:e,n,x:1,6]
MKDSPVLKLQDMAGSSSTNIEDLLSRAKMISVKLGLKDISEWLQYELTGYPNYDLLPDYRILTETPIRAFNPYVGWIPYHLGNISHQNKEIYNSLTTVNLNNPVSMLVEYSKSKSTLYTDLPDFVVDFLQKASGTNFRLCWEINPTQITKIISNIRSKILDWALLLENKGIFGDGLLFSLEEKKEAQSVTYNNTINNHGNGMTVIGDVKNDKSVVGGTVSNVQQKNIIGDFSTLESQLKKYDIEDIDIQELKQVVEKLPKPSSKEDVEKGFGAWIGKMTGKAFTGAIKITGAAAPALLTNYLCHHYGIPV